MPRAHPFVWILILMQLYPTSARAQQGKEAYRQVCQLCHGVEGRGDIAPALVPFGFDLDYVLTVVREGVGQMPAISRSELDDDAVRLVVVYLEALTSLAARGAGITGVIDDGTRWSKCISD